MTTRQEPDVTSRERTATRPVDTFVETSVEERAGEAPDLQAAGCSTTRSSCFECEALIETPSIPCPRCGRERPLSTGVSWYDLVELLAAILGKRPRRTNEPVPNRQVRGDHFRPLTVIIAFILVALICYSIISSI